MRTLSPAGINRMSGRDADTQPIVFLFLAYLALITCSRVGDSEAPLGHQGDQIPVIEPVSYIPAYAKFDDFPLKSATVVDWIAGNRLDHGRLLAERLYIDP